MHVDTAAAVLHEASAWHLQERDRASATTLTQHTLAQSTQLHVGCVEGLSIVLVQWLLLAIDHDGAALLQDPLWGSLHHQQEALVIGIFHPVYGKLGGHELSVLDIAWMPEPSQLATAQKWET